jgi:hypothetical protein
MDLRLATLKAVSFYLLHNVPTLNQCRKFSCVTVVCKHFASYQEVTVITNGTNCGEKAVVVYRTFTVCTRSFYVFIFFWHVRVFSPWVKQPGSGAYRLPITGAEVECGAIYTCHLLTLSVWNVTRQQA